MLLADLAGVVGAPRRTFEELRGGRPLAAATALVVASGLAAGALSALATALDPAVETSGGYGISAVLPILFAGFWLIDACIVDAVAQLMGAEARLRTWASVSALAIPVLVGFDALRVVQALIDRSGAVGVSTGVGFLGFAVLAWFVALISLGIAAVYGLPRLSALAAALAPPAAMATLLVLLLVVGSAVAHAG